MIPKLFLERMKVLLGTRYSAYEESLSQPLLKGLRVNPLKCCKDQLPFDLSPVPWARDGYYINADARAGGHPLHAAGAYYMQEPSAMLSAQVLAPRAGEYVLDLCAAPGGKTTQLASLMRDKGLIVANEIISSRAKILCENIQRMGLTHTIVTNTDPATIANKFSEFFDAVMVDAPCSGEGMFKKSDAAVTDWSLESVVACARRQALILDSAADCVRPGGRMVYSTCTFSIEENEENVAEFLKRHSDFELATIEGTGLSRGIALPVAPTERCVRVFPHEQKGEGHFTALFVRKGEMPRTPMRQEKPKSDRTTDRILSEWCQINGAILPDGSRTLWGETVYLRSETADLAGIKTPLPGVELGRIHNGRFEPAYAWAMTMPIGAAKLFELTEQTVREYLSGQAIACGDLKGWRIATYRGLPLGWVKCVDGLAKNHYPKALRRTTPRIET